MKDKKGEHPLGDAGQVILGVVYLIVWVADTFVFHWSTFLSSSVPSAVRMAATFVVVILALVLIAKSHWIIEGEDRPDYVVDTGVFHYVRHPMYLASMLGLVAFAISSLSLICFGLLIVVFAFFNYIATYEEKVLEDRFGDEYRAYEARTGKWLPRLSALRSRN
jgi:protein-S-isoprenylcysteine O-methyltransferase Ste14